MEHIRQHIPQEAAPPKKTRETERGEIMEYFLGKLNHARVQDGLAPLTIGRLARLFMGLPTKDLYYLKSVCDQATNFSKKFWWEINPKNHTPQKEQERAAAQKHFIKKNTN